MSIEEFQNLAVWIIRIVVYGTLAAIALGFLAVILRSLRANLRTRGIVGILIIIFQFAIYFGVIVLIVHLAQEYQWIDRFEYFLESKFHK